MIRFILVAAATILLHAGSGAAPVALSLIALDSEIKAGGKVMARVTITNTSDSPITYHNTDRDCDYSFRVQTSANTPAPETQHKKQISCSHQAGHLELTSRNIVVNLQPGESSSEDILVTDLFDMSKPGMYTLRVDRTLTGLGHFTSNTVNVHVLP